MIAYTIVSRAYLAHGRVLARSYAQHHGGERLRVLVIDDARGEVDDESEPFSVVRLDDLGLEREEIHRMALLFGSRLIAAIKPWVFEHLLESTGEPVVYVDGDFVVYDSLEPLAAAASAGVALVPHVLSPMPRDGCYPDETQLLGMGQFNAGLFGVGPGGAAFLAFLKERLRRECRYDPPAMRVNEQRWLDWVPSLFPYEAVRDPGIDVAYWNLHERPLHRVAGVVHAGSGPLRCFHFSSFDPRLSSVAGRFEVDPRPRVTRAGDPILDELCTDYAERLFAEGFAKTCDTPFAFDRLADGSPVAASLRGVFASALAAVEASGGALPPDPFDSASVDDFWAWMRGVLRDAGMADLAGTRGGLVAGGLREPAGGGGGERWVTDWLPQLRLGPAGSEVDVTGSIPAAGEPIRIVRTEQGRAGFVVFGPRAPLGGGRYRLTIALRETAPGPAPEGSAPALVAEIHVDGFVVGAAVGGPGELEAGALPVDFTIPDELAESSIFQGVELRLLSRGGVEASIDAVFVERIDAPASGSPSDTVVEQWLPFMAVADAGLRHADGIEVLSAATGLVAHGPNWRLPTGSYVLTAQIVADGPGVHVAPASRGSRRSQRRGPRRKRARPPTTEMPFARLEITSGAVVLATRELSWQDVAGSHKLQFEVPVSCSIQEQQVGFSVHVLHPIPVATGASVRAVNVSALPAPRAGGLRP